MWSHPPFALLFRVQQTPWWWRWFTYINPVFWSLYGLIESQVGGGGSAQ